MVENWRHFSERYALCPSPTERTFKLGEVSNGKPLSHYRRSRCSKFQWSWCCTYWKHYEQPSRKLWYDRAGKFVHLLNLTQRPQNRPNFKCLSWYIIKESLGVRLIHLSTSTYAVLFFKFLIWPGGEEFNNPGATSASGLHSYRFCYPDYTSPEVIEKFCDGRPRLTVKFPLPPPSRPNPPIWCLDAIWRANKESLLGHVKHTRKNV